MMYEDDFICNECGRQFKSSHSLAIHKSWHKPDVKKKHSDAQVRRWSSKSERQKQSDTLRKKLEDPAVRQKYSDVQKVRWQSHHEELRRKYQAGWTDEAKAFCSSREDALSVIESFDSKPTISDIEDKIGLNTASVYRAIESFGLHEQVDDSSARSAGEMEISSFIASISDCKQVHSKNAVGKELDIFMPELNFAIEFDGDYWHNEDFVGKTSHLHKTELCEANGIHLMHVFEWEWQQKQDKIKSLICTFLGKNDRVYARKTEFEKISGSEANAFLDKNHLQGHVNARFSFALTDDKDIVAVMTFGRPRFSKDEDSIELLRYASRKGMSVVGGESKLFKHALDYLDCSKILSYCNRSKFDGRGYLELGFKHVRDTPPSYVWICGSDVKSRYQTQMKDEVNVMRSKGYRRIYDCGNKLFEYDMK